MKGILDLLSPRLILNALSPLAIPKGPTIMRLLSNLAAFFFLVLGYVLGCRVLYHYLKPDWGEEGSLLVICSLLLLTSFILFIVAWALKPKKPQPIDLISEIEKTISEIPTHEIVKKVASMVSPKAVMAVFTFVAMASYFSNLKKKNF